MMGGVFVLFQIVMLLILFKQRTAAVVISIITILLAWALFSHHVEMPLNIRL